MPVPPGEQASRLFKRLAALYADHANPDKATPMARYMKDRFSFFGIQSVQRQALSRQFFREEGLPDPPVLEALFRRCFEAPQRELQYFVQDAGRRASRRLGPDFIAVYDDLIGQRSWWDSIDFLAPKLAGALLRRFPEQVSRYPDRWIERPDRWYQRSAILFQLDYQAATDADRLFAYIRRRADSREFFVQKGAGWALRQYSKIAPDEVVQFIDNHKLAPLTVREGLKWIKRREEPDQLRR